MMRQKRNERFLKRKVAPVMLLVGGSVLVLLPDTTGYLRAALSSEGIAITVIHDTRAVKGQHSQVSRVFRIYNVRPRHLFLKANPDCACTTVSWQQAVIAPFAWKDMVAGMSVNEGEGKDDLSNKSVAVNIHTSVKNRPWIFAWLRA